MAKLYLIKDKKGRIFGPYNEEEICFYIEEREFKGEELFSSYPAGKWRPLSAHSVFYEKILVALQGKKTKPSRASTTASSSLTDKSQEEHIEPTRILDVKDTSSSKKRKKIKINLSEGFKEEVLAEEEELSNVIEMDNVDKGFIDKIKISLKWPILIFSLLMALFFSFLYLKPNQKSGMEQQVRILSVRHNRKPWSPKEKREKFINGLQSYHRGTLANYLTAQREFVQLLEGDPNQEVIYLHLCLTYLEIWPFAYQDEKDKKALNQTVKLVNERNKKGSIFDICNSIKAFVENKPSKSLLIIDKTLPKVETADAALLRYYFYLKAKVLKELNEESLSRSYLQSVYSLDPKWIAPYMLDAQMFYKKRQYDLAAKAYKKVLSIFPKHTTAGLRMGILEYKYFKKPKNSKKRLKSILMKSPSFVQPDILFESYLTLAKIHFKQNDKKKTVEYTNKAYALDPDHPDVIFLKSQLGPSGDFEKTKLQAKSLIYKGDMLAEQGDCLSAQDYFKKAYYAEKKRNAMAAVRMAQCYWRSKVSGQAIIWLKRAIEADRSMLEAYFLLSDYFSSLYDFESAKDMLNAVKRQQPSNYDLFKANALLSFRQGHYKAAEAYAKRSLEFYTSDAEIHVLLSRIYRAQGKSHKAFSYADRAKQEDTGTSVEIAYALAIDLEYGFHSARDYFHDLIKAFPAVEEYRQALGEYYFEKNMYEEAEAQFKDIVERNAKYKPAYLYLGRIYKRRALKKRSGGEEYHQALRYFIEAGLLDSSDPEPIFYTAQTHFDSEQYQMAEHEFEKVLNLNPNYPLIHYYIGLVNLQQGTEEDLEKALKSARTQSAKDPDHFLPYKLAGDVYKLRSKGVFENPQEQQAVYELCAKEYQKALKRLKYSADISISLMECYKGAGNLDSALQLGLSLVREEGLSGYPKFYREIGSILEAKDQYEQARVYYKSYFSLEPGAEDRAEITKRIEKLIKSKKSLSQPPKEKTK